ncbi:MAG TPA: hypothetical protein VGB15_11340 [Longimicrobium sp.]
MAEEIDLLFVERYSEIVHDTSLMAHPQKRKIIDVAALQCRYFVLRMHKWWRCKWMAGSGARPRPTLCFIEFPPRRNGS